LDRPEAPGAMLGHVVSMPAMSSSSGYAKHAALVQLN
jgi:hypothetical protein